MYRKTLLPECIAYGMTASEFWHSYPCEIAPYFEAHKKKRMMQDERDYVCGIYTYEAVAVAVCNAFRGKGVAPIKYRSKPLLQEIEERNKPLTEEELTKQRKMFVEQLMLLKTNFELTHDKAGK